MKLRRKVTNVAEIAKIIAAARATTPVLQLHRKTLKEQEKYAKNGEKLINSLNWHMRSGALTTRDWVNPGGQAGSSYIFVVKICENIVKTSKKSLKIRKNPINSRAATALIAKRKAGRLFAVNSPRSRKKLAIGTLKFSKSVDCRKNGIYSSRGFAPPQVPEHSGAQAVD